MRLAVAKLCAQAEFMKLSGDCGGQSGGVRRGR
jgi:hypothetical protein